MSTTLLALTLVVVLPAAAPEKSVASPKSHPFAPSLPDLTREQEDAFDLIIDNFIRAESGVLKEADAERARVEFRRLPPESVFALIRGLNRTYVLESTRPATGIGKKLAAVLGASSDVSLLDFAHENIGAREPRKEPKKPSAEVEAKYDRIIDAFIEFDLGNLRGADGKNAKIAFEQLPPDAIFALIRGLNRAATIEHSCPAAVLGKKVRSLLVASNDPALLSYAIENIGNTKPRIRHAKVIDDVVAASTARKREIAPPQRGLPPALVQELKMTCLFRKSAVARGSSATTPDDVTQGGRFKVFRPSGKKPEPKSPGETPPKSPGETSPGNRKPAP